MNNINKFKELKKLNLPIKILAGGGVNLENVNVLLKNGINDIHIGKCVHEDNNFNNPINYKLINDIKNMA